MRATIVLAYGYVTFYASKDLIISRLETYILRNIGGYTSANTKVNFFLLLMFCIEIKFLISKELSSKAKYS